MSLTLAFKQKTGVKHRKSCEELKCNLVIVADREYNIIITFDCAF